MEGLRLVVTTGAGATAVREERLLEDGPEWRTAVREHLGIELPEPAEIARAIVPRANFTAAARLRR